MTLFDHLELVIVLVTAGVGLAVSNIVGNTIVVLSWSISHECRTPVGLLLCNLALCDVSAVIMILGTCFKLITNSGLVQDTGYGALLCDMVVYGKITYFDAQLLTVIGIAINRYIRVVHNAAYTVYKSRKLHVATVLAIWACAPAMVLGTPYIFGYLPFSDDVLLDTGDRNITLCRIGYKKGDYEAPTLSHSILTIVVPWVGALLTTSILYGKIFHTFKQSRKRLETIDGGNATVVVSNNIRNLKLHITTVVLAITTTSVPIVLIGVAKIFHVEDSFISPGILIAVIGESVNPWLACFYVPEFNTALKAFLRFQLPKTYKKKRYLKRLEEHRKHTAAQRPSQAGAGKLTMSDWVVTDRTIDSTERSTASLKT